MVGAVSLGFLFLEFFFFVSFFLAREEELYPLCLGTGGREPVIRLLTRLSIRALRDGQDGGNTRGILGQNRRSFFFTSLLFADSSQRYDDRGHQGTGGTRNTRAQDGQRTG